MSEQVHKQNAPVSIPFSILTISDTRTFETDQSGKLIALLMESHHHQLIDHKIVPDDFQQIQKQIQLALQTPAEVLLLTGGTGISPRDGTYEVMEKLLEKRLDGFGELFRWLSYQQIGSAAILSRALGGTIGKKALFSLPGSQKAVQLALESILLKEIPHIISELRKEGAPPPILSS
jgi:molybdenum cofactor biosynthesis protein B